MTTRVLRVFALIRLSCPAAGSLRDVLFRISGALAQMWKRASPGFCPKTYRYSHRFGPCPMVCKESHDVGWYPERRSFKFFPYTTIITPNLVKRDFYFPKSIQNLEDMKAVARVYELGGQHLSHQGWQSFPVKKNWQLMSSTMVRDFPCFGSPV